VLPSWAVVEFKNLKSPGTNFGKVAASAVSGELLKTGQYEVISTETIDRAIKSLGIASPPDGLVNLFRVAEEVRASTVVTGEIANYGVANTGAGKQASVTIRTVIYDVASRLAVNGAVVNAQSTIRPGDVSDETLINDALQIAARNSIQDVQNKTLPTGTVLNTTPTTAYINKGTRSGFKDGQEVVVLRGREQVASGHVREVDPDSSMISVERNRKGVQPGDKVRAIFEVPQLVIDKGGNVKEVRSASKGIPSGLLTAIIIVGLIALVVSSGKGSDSSVISQVNAEATLDEAFRPAVNVSWSPNGFAKGNSQRAAWQVYRSDVVDSPVYVTPTGDITQILDRIEDRTVTYTQFQSAGGTTCANTTFNNRTKTGVPGVKAGRPYIYSVDLIYKISSLDLPDGGSTGGTGTASGTTATASGTTATATGTTATATGTTATGGLPGTGGGRTGGSRQGTGTTATGTTATATGTTATATGTTATGTTANGTGTTATTGAQTCFFESPRATARGTATPLNRPTLVSPADNGPVGQPIPFTFNSAVQTVPILVEYVIQFSDTISFTKSRTVTVSVFTRTNTGVISSTPIDTASATLPAFIRTASTLYWRVGARNPEDRPGPVPDPQTGMRYIFSQPRTFTRPGGPPPPP